MAAVSKNKIQPQKLPPTESATKYHSLRVHLQGLQWMGAENIEETEWRWKIKDIVFTSIMTDKVHYRKILVFSPIPVNVPLLHPLKYQKTSDFLMFPLV